MSPHRFRSVLSVVALAVTLGACVVETRKAIADGLGMQLEFAPPGVTEPAIVLGRELIRDQGIDVEFDIDVGRPPDVIEYGQASCIEAPSCLGLEAGAGPWTVWHLRWQADRRGPWIAVVFEAADGQQLWLGADGGR